MKTEKTKLSKTVWFILGTDLITLAARRSTIYCHRKAENVKHIVIKYNASCLQIRRFFLFFFNWHISSFCAAFIAVALALN